jgi:hypothetical protein
MIWGGEEVRRELQGSEKVGVPFEAWTRISILPADLKRATPRALAFSEFAQPSRGVCCFLVAFKPGLIRGKD